MKHLSSQISKVLAGLLLAGFFFLFMVVDGLLKSNLQDQIIYDLRIEAEMADLYLSTDSVKLQEDVARLALLTESRFTVMDETGRVVAESDPAHRPEMLDNHLNRPEIQGALRGLDGYGYAFRYSHTLNEELVYVAFKSSKSRFVRIAKKQSFVNSIVWKVRWIVIVIALLTVAALLVLMPRLTGRVTKGLTEIVRASEEIRSGNYDREIVVKEQNEIGDLASTLNLMSSKLKEDIQQLRQMQDVRKDFVANASHELKTPITSIRGYLETLLDGAYHDEEVSKKFLERTMSNVVRLESIVNDMLDLSMLESRDHGLSLRYFDIGTMLKSLTSDYQEAARQKGLDLKLTSSIPPEFTLMADPYQVEKALFNLIDNAVKYTESGSVTVSASLVEQSLHIVVADTGNGIPPEDQNRIFERFYRVDKGRSRQLGGSGLGLSIVKHVMEIHQGEVRLQSEIGKGSRFTLIFPLKT